MCALCKRLHVQTVSACIPYAGHMTYTHTLTRACAMSALVLVLVGCTPAHTDAPPTNPTAALPPVTHVVEPPPLPPVQLPPVQLPPVVEYVPGPAVTVTVPDPAAYDTGYAQGVLDGREAGYHDGHADGYRPGYVDGRIEGEDWILSALQRPCETEDSDMCYWNAAIQGNGEGRSFVSVGGTAHYLD
jgi:hypothetical protein